MARLAAYYQEDFHYAPVSHGPKQRKSAYVFYEQPRNNPFDPYLEGGGQRIRALGASDPSLSPTVSPRTGVMTLKPKPRPLNHRLIEQSRLAMQGLQGVCDEETLLKEGRPYYHEETLLNPYAVARLDVDLVEEPYQRHRGSAGYRRLSCSGGEPGPDSGFHDRSFDTSVGERFPLHAPCVDHHEQCFSPPVSFRSDSSHGRWQQWPWNVPDTALVASPSPHDSGLSSQSVASSPSLEAEPLPLCFRPEARCSCSPQQHQAYGEPARFDSGRSSPGAYSVASRRSSHRRRRTEVDEYARSQVRYGVLGIVNEPVPALPPPCNGDGHATYYYVEEHAGPLRFPKPRPPRKHHPGKKGLVIVESDEKREDKGTSSPEQDSEKSPEPESSAVSSPGPDPPSLASDAGSDVDALRKAKRKTEREIRELEDMYQKCNLGDRDLLERAERRDLPTRHQLGVRTPGLTRSKSDTLYEVLSSAFHNPYETPVRAPPLRRSGVPDIVADDMAIRKLNKQTTTAAVNPLDNTVTYMLCSSHFTPTVSSGRDFSYNDCPDIEYDDLSYRKHYFGKKSRIPDPQPPFGIPLRPPPPRSVYNDYLHAVPSGGPPPLCHPRVHPDVVRDDLAYRTLRKDEPDVLYYDVREVPRKVRA